MDKAIAPPLTSLDKDSKEDKREKEKRTSRACLVCRKRKSACHLYVPFPTLTDFCFRKAIADIKTLERRLTRDDRPIVDGVATPPCQRCKVNNLECIIGSSNRGGRRVRKRTLEQAGLDGNVEPETPLADTIGDASDFIQSDIPAPELPCAAADASTRRSIPAQSFDMSSVPAVNASPSPAMFLDPVLRSESKDGYSGIRESSAGSSNNITFNELQNPSDALGILAQIASHGEAAPPYSNGPNSSNTIDYPLVRDGRLGLSRVIELLQRYKHYYHPYFPIVPGASLDAVNLSKTAHEERHLLTAILVIASRDLVDEPQVFAICSEYMRSLVSALAAGGPGNVETVEALLLLAEWTPYTSRSEAGRVGRGEEDREAWMHIGTALRIGYFLGLDRYSFAVRGDDVKDPQWQRKRLVWTACYISDRQISIRLGRAFWSRGPGPLTTLRKEDFPMLAPVSSGDEDFASIFQATLELTLLFSNVHDVLYSNPGNSMRSHLSGGYIKFIDDFRTAIYGWKSVWGTLTCSPNLKATLLMSYDYLRLYTNAFAFHATLKRALSQQEHGLDANKTKRGPAVQRVFYNNVGAVGDARFIYEGLDAAKSLLSMCNTFVDPERALRFMPLRFYLYCVYSAVFLYRARCAGVLSSDEEFSVRQMVKETVNRLERSGIGSQHPGSRYSQLLRLLWEKVDRKERPRTKNNTATLTNPYRPGSVGGPTPQSTTSTGSGTQESPALNEVLGDFSWTDLDAIGNFAVNGNNGNQINDAEWWSGFLPADSNNFLFEGLPGMDDWSIQLQ